MEGKEKSWLRGNKWRMRKLIKVNMKETEEQRMERKMESTHTQKMKKE